jgi:hypothetical protein
VIRRLTNGGWFCRVRGWGFAVEKDYPRYFSERNGFRRVYRLGRWSLEWLTPRG